jgi:AcrR family transcriptional regulator
MNTLPGLVKTMDDSAKQQIAAHLEAAFSQYGFAEPSVSVLQKASGVSLRTLYKYYPSKESMIEGALTYRHNRYVALLTTNEVNVDQDLAPLEAVLLAFDNLEEWMQDFAPHGCLSLQALAAYPDNAMIQNSVKQHKQEVTQALGQIAKSPALASSLFLIHEGVSAAWPAMGQHALTTAKTLITQLFNETSDE